jgi:hypothetical protein
VSPAVECMCDASIAEPGPSLFPTCGSAKAVGPVRGNVFPFALSGKERQGTNPGVSTWRVGAEPQQFRTCFRVYRKLCNKGATQNSFGRVYENCRFRADLRHVFLASTTPAHRQCLHSLHGVFQIGQRFPAPT